MKMVSVVSVLVLLSVLFYGRQEAVYIPGAEASSSSSSDPSTQDGTSGGPFTANDEAQNGSFNFGDPSDLLLKEPTYRVDARDAVGAVPKDRGAQQQQRLKKGALLGALATVGIALMLRAGTSIYREIKEAMEPISLGEDQDIAEPEEEFPPPADFSVRSSWEVKVPADEGEGRLASVGSDVPSSSPMSHGPWGSWRSSESEEGFGSTADLGMPLLSTGTDDVFIDEGSAHGIPSAPVWDEEPAGEELLSSAVAEDEMEEITKPLSTSVDYGSLVTAALPVSVTLERVASTLSTSAGYAASWLGDALRLVEEVPSEGAENMMASREFVLVLRGFRRWTRDEVPGSGRDLHKLSVELRRSVDDVVGGDLGKVSDALSNLESVPQAVESVARKHLILLQMNQQFKRTCVEASEESNRAVEKIPEILNLAKRLQRHVDTLQMDEAPEAFGETLEAERELLDDIVINEHDVDVAMMGRRVWELLNQAEAGQRSFLSAARDIAAGVSGSGLPLNELKALAIDAKKVVHDSGRRIEKLARSAATYASAVKAALKVLNPEEMPNFFDVQLLPLAHLAETMETGTAEVLTSLRRAEQTLLN